MGSSTSSDERMSWNQICSQREYRGRWVALDGCRYDEATQEPAEGTVIDADDDLAELCSRIKKANHRCCAILFCDGHHGAVVRRVARVRH